MKKAMYRRKIILGRTKTVSSLEYCVVGPQWPSARLERNIGPKSPAAASVAEALGPAARAGPGSGVGCVSG